MVERRIPTNAYQYYPRPLPILESDSNIRQWVSAHQDEYDKYDEYLSDAIGSHQLQDASNEELNQIGKRFGILGKRNKRGDEEYKQFLRGINNSYNGNGTVQGVQYAVGTGIRTPNPPTDVSLIEDFVAKEYQISLRNWAGHSTKTVFDLANLADPVTVDMIFPIIYKSDSAKVKASVRAVRPGLKLFSPTLEQDIITPPSETKVTSKDGFGAGRFDGDDPFGPGDDDYSIGSFESGDLRFWTNRNSNFKVVKNYKRNGRFAGYISDTSGIVGEVGRIEISDGRHQQISFSYRETPQSDGQGVRIVDKNGNDVIGAASNSPQWDVIDANGKEEIYDPIDHEMWVDVVIDFDWNTETATITFTRADNSYSVAVTGRPLISNSDIAGIQFWNYNSATTNADWGDGSIVSWIDDVYVVEDASLGGYGTDYGEEYGN